jgi:hypothetical protein
MSASEQFAYLGQHVEIAPHDEEHLVGIFWQIKIDGVIQSNVLYGFRYGDRVANKLICEKFKGVEQQRSGLSCL